MAGKVRNNKLECSICLSDFVKPKIIDCFHTFCESCLVEYVNKRSPFDYGRFKCPICRQLIHIPIGGVKNFSTNFYIEEKSPVEEKVVCTVHKLEVQYFCKDCCQTVCFKCFMCDHRGHNVDLISDLVENQKQELGSMRRDLSERIDKARRYSSWLFTEKSKLQFLSDGECQKVDNHVEKLCQEVRNQGSKLKKDIKNSYQSQSAELFHFHDDVQRMLKNLTELEKQVDDICQKDNLADILCFSGLAQVKSMICNFHGYKDHPFGLPSGITLQFKERENSQRIISKLIGKVQAGFSFSSSDKDDLRAVDDHGRELKTQLESVLVNEDKGDSSEEVQTATSTDRKSFARISQIPDKFVLRDSKSTEVAKEVAGSDTSFNFSSVPKQTSSSSPSHRIKGNSTSKTNNANSKGSSEARNLSGDYSNRISGSSNVSGTREKGVTQSVESAIGLQHVSSSSSCGQKLFPNSAQKSSGLSTMAISSAQNTLKISSDQSAGKTSSSSMNRCSDQNTLPSLFAQISIRSSSGLSSVNSSSAENTTNNSSDQNTAQSSLSQNTNKKSPDQRTPDSSSAQNTTEKSYHGTNTSGNSDSQRDVSTPSDDTATAAGASSLKDITPEKESRGKIPVNANKTPLTINNSHGKTSANDNKPTPTMNYSHGKIPANANKPTATMNNCHGKILANANKTSPIKDNSHGKIPANASKPALTNNHSTSSTIGSKKPPRLNPLTKNGDSVVVETIYGEIIPKLKTEEMEDIVPTLRGKINIPEKEKKIRFTFDVHDIESSSAQAVKKLDDLDLYVSMGLDNKSHCYIDIGLNNLGLYKMNFSVNVNIKEKKVDRSQFVVTNLYGYWGPFYRWHNVLDKQTLLECSGEILEIEVDLQEVKRVK